MQLLKSECLAERACELSTSPVEPVLHRGKAVLQIAHFGGQGQNASAEQLKINFLVTHETVGRMTQVVGAGGLEPSTR